MKRFGCYLLLGLFLFSFVGCTTTSVTKYPGKEEAFRQFLPYENVNKDIILSMPDGLNPTLKLSRSVNFLLTNNSTNVVSLPPNYGIRIFTFSHGIWIEVKNNFSYSSSSENPVNGQISYPKGPDHFGFQVISLSPLPENFDEPMEFRVLVEGVILINGQPTEEKGGAYFDFTLSP